MQSVILPATKPRNPTVVPLQRKKSGKHVDKKKKEQYNPKHPNKQE